VASGRAARAFCGRHASNKGVLHPYVHGHLAKCPFQNFLSRLNHLCDFKESHLIRGETANVDA